MKVNGDKVPTNFKCLANKGKKTNRGPKAQVSVRVGVRLRIGLG